MEALKDIEILNPDNAASTLSNSPMLQQGCGLSFFSLPRELRDIIYTYIWLASPPIRVNYKGCQFTATYDRSLSTALEDEEKLPTWLLTNKAILDEGLAELRRQSIWRCSMREHPDTQMWRLMPIPRHRHPLLLPSCGRGLFLTLGSLRLRGDFFADEAVVGPNQLDLHFLHTLSTILTSGHSLKRVSVTMVLNGHEMMKMESVDLSVFDGIGGLGVLKIDVSYFFSLWMGIDEMPLEKVVVLLEREMRRVGERLVGEGAEFGFQSGEHGCCLVVRSSEDKRV
ncbi:hypothetical protein CC78DRAFT_621130 [Lojkania enalia]|uniref:Uncharacterized protein n=1 Tax=Lojkania enalia TaxID=147567 RepID=A0A9P4MZA9_9PLEO|nr:hypothetical protein CC78DRAFT_621130 [Didymosphaeria enalia]